MEAPKEGNQEPDQNDPKAWCDQTCRVDANQDETQRDPRTQQLGTGIWLSALQRTATSPTKPHTDAGVGVGVGVGVSGGRF